MTCPNCNATLSCGCQSRRASDGKTVCSNCLASYETKIGKTAPSTTATQAPKQQLAPSNVSVKYIPPHNRLP